ncbi:MAG: selenide, water dikinase SelD [Alphaproteobacteria bacterium]|nr:selenide, water dikinase SelD [Alphaproteobacteria bacterium]
MRGVPIQTDIVLLGAGHAHAEVLRQFAMRPMPGVRLTLIAREAMTPYSGMLPGLLRGEHGYDDAHIDCVRLAAAAGARLILAEADGLDLSARQVRIVGRPGVAWDLLSIDVGGQPVMGIGGTPVKPIGRFLARLAEIETRLAPEHRIAVAGGGAAGVELAIALAWRWAGRAHVILVNADATPLATAPETARRAVAAGLADAGVEVINGARAESFAEGTLHLANGSSVAADEVLWATGVIAAPFLAAAGLACDAAGCVIVEATLQSRSHKGVFAAGDCASVLGAARPKAGVWAVRAGVPLAENLRRAAAGHALRPWSPQTHALAILGLGAGRAVAWRGRLAVSGRWVAAWKRRIDRRWMAIYQSLRPMPMDPDDARCGGCGAKIGAAGLHAALAGLATPRPDIPIGLAEADDAAVTLPPAGMAVVQSVDHFRAFLDDPYLFGRIAATHAISDLHAMGAAPWTAMAVATVPFMRGAKMQADLAAMMQGAGEVLRAEGCALIGGHSGEGAELALGFAVTGLAAPDAIWRKGGLRAGDALILTKPLGTGIINAAAMRGLARAEWVQAATASMLASNGPAVAILRAHGVRACTDVTGFGLGGHLGEMLRASGCSAELSDLPALPGALELAASGIASTMAPANLDSLDLTSERGLELLADPQTSGGLLAGVSDGPACLAALRAAGVEAALIGHVTAGPAGRIMRAG